MTIPTSIIDNWNVLRIKLKVRFPELTDRYLHHENGRADAMFINIGNKLGKTSEEMSIIIASL